MVLNSPSVSTGPRMNEPPRWPGSDDLRIMGGQSSWPLSPTARTKAQDDSSSTSPVAHRATERYICEGYEKCKRSYASAGALAKHRKVHKKRGDPKLPDTHTDRKDDAENLGGLTPKTSEYQDLDFQGVARDSVWLSLTSPAANPEPASGISDGLNRGTAESSVKGVQFNSIRNRTPYNSKWSLADRRAHQIHDISMKAAGLYFAVLELERSTVKGGSEM